MRNRGGEMRFFYEEYRPWIYDVTVKEICLNNNMREAEEQRPSEGCWGSIQREDNIIS